MKFFKRYFSVLIISLTCITSYGKTESHFGLDPTAFIEQKKYVLDALTDLLTHLDDGSLNYKNDLGSLYKSNENKPQNNRIVIQNIEDVRFIFFLGYISAIDLDMGNRFHIRNTPSLDALKTLNDFYAKMENVDLFPYWIIYNLYVMIETKVTGNPLWFKLLIDTDDIDEALMQYSKTKEDSFSKDIKLCEYVEEMYASLSGILVSSENLNE